MSQHHKPTRWLTLALALTLSMASADFANAEKICRVLIFADTNDTNIGDSCQVDATSVFQIFLANVPEDRLEIEQHTGDEVSRTTILSRINRIQLQTEDTLVVYYSGHGAYDPDQGQYLQTPGQATLRSEVVQAMQARNVRLAILITDTCSVVVPIRQHEQTFAAMLGPETTSPLFVSLCWDSAGFVDISGSTRGEFAMGADDIGGYFTAELCDYMTANRNSRRDWATVFREVRPQVADLFQTRHPNGYPGPGGVRQFTQTIDARFTPAAAAGGGGQDQVMQQGPRFGVRAINDPRGVRVTEVVPNSPATRCSIVGQPNALGSLEVGDIIVEINGQTIRNEQDYANAVDNSPRSMRFTIVNSKNNALLELDVMLAR